MSVVSAAAAFGNGQSNDRILVRSNGDFVLPIVNVPYQRETYAPDGGLVTQSTNSGLVRIDGTDHVYWLSGWQLSRNPFAL
jgi:hypothetical protein